MKNVPEKNGNLPNFSGFAKGGGVPPNQTISGFFLREKTFIALKWSTCSETWKKSIKNFPIMTPPPSIPFLSASEPKNLRLEDLKEKTGSWYHTESISLHVD